MLKWSIDKRGLKCICDIVFLYRSKRPPQSYTLVGEINGLQMCVKDRYCTTISNAPPAAPSGTETESKSLSKSHHRTIRIQHHNNNSHQPYHTSDYSNTKYSIQRKVMKKKFLMVYHLKSIPNI